MVSLSWKEIVLLNERKDKDERERKAHSIRTSRLPRVNQSCTNSKRTNATVSVSFLPNRAHPSLPSLPFAHSPGVIPALFFNPCDPKAPMTIPDPAMIAPVRHRS